MALKDIWIDLENAIEGVPNSGSDISVEPINAIANAVISSEENIEDFSQRIDSLEQSVESLALLTDEETTPFATKKEVGNISAVLDELHTYAQTLISGGVSV